MNVIVKQKSSIFANSDNLRGEEKSAIASTHLFHPLGERCSSSKLGLWHADVLVLLRALHSNTHDS